MTSEVIFGAIIGLLVFEEPVSLRNALGGILIISSGIGFNIGNQKS